MNDSIAAETIMLQKQVALYANMLDHCTDLVHRVTPEGRFTYVNQAWRDTMGYSEEEIKELSLMDIVDQHCQDDCKCIFDALMHGKDIASSETTLVTRTGEKITVEGRCQTTFENGKPVAMTGIFRDISDRIRNDMALRDSEQRFRTLFENSSDIMQMVSANGHFLHVNPSWLEVFDYSRDEIEGLTIFDLIASDCQSHCLDTFQRVLSEDRVHEIDTVFVGKNQSCPVRILHV